MRFPNSKYPGHRVVREVRKGQGKKRVIVYYSGKKRNTNKEEVSRLARDRGFDLSNYRFRNATPEVRARMLRGSIEWQRKAKARWIGRLRTRLGATQNPQKRQQIRREIAKLSAVRPRSPHTGEKPVSAYLRRYWG